MKKTSSFFKSNQGGWVYIDSLIAMVILVVALIALLVTYQQSTSSTVQAKTYSQATLLAQSELEKITSGEKNLHSSDLVNKEFEEEIDRVKYKVSTTWAKPSLGKAENIYQCEVKVQWRAPIAKTDSNLSMVSYFQTQL